MQPQKSILLLGNYPPPYGGVPRLLEYLIPDLAKNGWNVHVIARGTTGVEKREGFTLYKLSKSTMVFQLFRSPLRSLISFFQFFRVSDYNKKYFLRNLATLNYVQNHLRKQNIKLVCAYNILSTGVLGLLVSRRLSIPLISYNFGEIYTNLEMIQSHSGLQWLISEVVKKSQKLLSCGRHCGQSYAKLGISAEVEPIPTCVDTNVFHDQVDGASIRKDLKLHSNHVVATFVGRMNYDMGLHTVLESIPRALDSHPDLCFLIVGARDQLTQEAEVLQNRFSDRVFIFTDVEFEKLPLFYAASDFVLAPTRGDRACSSLAALEAMATGKAVIATRVGGIPEVVQDQVTGYLIEPEDSGALLDRILLLTRESTWRKAFGEKGLETVQKRFTKDAVNQRMLEIFKTESQQSEVA